MLMHAATAPAEQQAWAAAEGGGGGGSGSGNSTLTSPPSSQALRTCSLQGQEEGSGVSRGCLSPTELASHTPTLTACECSRHAPCWPFNWIWQDVGAS